MRRVLVSVAIGVMVLAIAVPIGGAWLLSGMMLYPDWYEVRTPEQGLSPRIPIADPLQAHGLTFEKVSFSTVGGSELRGWYIPGVEGATAGVVTVHGGGADRRHFLSVAPMLHEAGYPVLLFDCREQGISDGEGAGLGFGVREYADASAGVTFMRAQGVEKIAVLGSSQGAASAIIAAALDPTIDVVVAENSYTNLHEMLRDTRSELGAPPPWLSWLIAQMARWRLEAGDLPSPLEAVPGIAPRPLLLMHGTNDSLIPISHSHSLYAAAGEPKEFWIAEGAEHSSLFRSQPDEFRERLMTFLAATLGPAR